MSDNPTKAQLAARPSRFHTLDPSRDYKAGNPASYLLGNCRRQTDKEFNLTRKWVQLKLNAGHCEATGIALDLTNMSGPWAPSIDRIDNKRGYTEDNCRMTVWAYNRARFNWPDDVTLTLARAIMEKHHAE